VRAGCAGNVRTLEEGDERRQAERCNAQHLRRPSFEGGGTDAQLEHVVAGGRELGREELRVYASALPPQYVVELVKLREAALDGPTRAAQVVVDGERVEDGIFGANDFRSRDLPANERAARVSVRRSEAE
jgi:hypothetical protein